MNHFSFLAHHIRNNLQYDKNTLSLPSSTAVTKGIVGIIDISGKLQKYLSQR